MTPRSSCIILAVAFAIVTPAKSGHESPVYPSFYPQEIELMAVALVGAQFGHEASSFFVDAGNRPRLGQTFIAIDPGALAGPAVYLDRVEALVAEMLADAGVRLPGERRETLRRRAEADGIEVADAMLAQWRSA